MIGLVMANIETPTWQVVASVVGISIGTAINCSGAMDYTVIGLVLMFASETCEAIRLVLTQKLLQNEKFGIVEGQYWSAETHFIYIKPTYPRFERALSTTSDADEGVHCFAHQIGAVRGLRRTQRILCTHELSRETGSETFYADMFANSLLMTSPHWKGSRLQACFR